MEAKPEDSIFHGELRLAAKVFHQPKVVEAKLPRQPGLIVADKSRRGFGDVRPFGEALTPPLVILRRRVKLRKILGNQFHWTRTARYRLRDIRLVKRPGAGVDR